MSVVGCKALAIINSMALGEVMAEIAPMKSMLNKAWQTAMWLDKTALAWLLAPDVNKTKAGPVPNNSGV